MSLDALLTFLRTEATEADITQVFDAVDFRRDSLARLARATLKVGDRVRFLTTRSGRFDGQEGVLDRKLNKNVEVRLADNRVVRTPPGLLEVISEP